MFLYSSNFIFDFDLESLKNILQVLDNQLEILEQNATDCEDPDSFGIFDRAEATISLGFVACQKYIAATYGCLKIPKEKALAVGPGINPACTLPRSSVMPPIFGSTTMNGRSKENRT